MKALERLLGTWKFENIGKIPKGPRYTGTQKRELVLGGRFVQEKIFDDEGKPTFIGMYTYDSNRKIYRYWFFHSSGFYWDSTGTWDESSQTFTLTNRLRGDVTGTLTVQFSDDTTCVWSIINRDAGGEVIFHMEGRVVRQK